MKKILFIAVIFLLQVTTLFADAFLETFPSQALVCWCFESKWATEFLGYSGKDNELTKAYKDICACFEKRFSINIEKDIDKFGAYVIPGQGGVDLIGVVSGKFDTDKIITIIKTILPKTNNKNVKLEDITVNGKKIKYFRDEKNILVFYSKEIIFVAKDSTLNMLKQNAIPFGKAPELVSDLLKKHNSFLFVPKTAIMMLSMMRLPPEITGNVNSIVSYVDNDKINIEFICNNSSAAEQFKTQLEQKRNEYASNYSKEFDKKKKELNEVGVDKLTANIALMYSSAKAKDFIDGIQLSTSSNYFIIKTKADFGEIIPGIIGLIVPVAMNYAPSLTKNASNEAKKNACFSNQRLLQGAVEMYNMDNRVMMTKLNAKELLDKKYIKPISKPEPQCEYESVGDLSDDGYINCKYHGSPFNK